MKDGRMKYHSNMFDRNYISLKEVGVSINEMNNLIKYYTPIRKFVYERFTPSLLDLFPAKSHCFLYQGLVEFHLVTYSQQSKTIVRYRTRMDYTTSSKKEDIITGRIAFTILSRYYKVPHLNHDPRYENFCGRRDNGCYSACGYMWYSKEYEGQKVQAYCYDRNSAYSYAMLQPMPDTSKEPRKGFIIPGKEVGYIIDQDYYLHAVYSGYSDYIFPLMESPFKKFVKTWYTKKKYAKAKEERLKAKAVLNYSVGYLQNVNPFLRASIISYCNSDVEKLRDENTIYCNTDSIVSLKKRTDLPFGKEIGQWKLEEQGLFAYVGYDYQWYDENKTAVRGIPKIWLDDDFDIVENKSYTSLNFYYYDLETRRILRDEKKHQT